MPNLDGTDDGQGPYRAAREMPLESKEAGRGASSTERPFVATGDKPKPMRFDSSPPRGEPYGDVVPLYVESIVGTPLSMLEWRPLYMSSLPVA